MSLTVVLVEAEDLLLFLAVEVGKGVDYHLQLAYIVPVPVLHCVLYHDEVSLELAGGEVIYDLRVLLLNHIRLGYPRTLLSASLQPFLQQLQMLELIFNAVFLFGDIVEQSGNAGVALLALDCDQSALIAHLIVVGIVDVQFIFVLRG